MKKPNQKKSKSSAGGPSKYRSRRSKKENQKKLQSEKSGRPAGPWGSSGQKQANRRDEKGVVRGPSRRPRPDRNQRSDRGQRIGERGARSEGGSKLLHLKATVDKNRKGFSFLIFENRSIPDAFVSPDRSEGLFHGDRVQALVRPPNFVVKVQVLERRIREAVGRYSLHANGGPYGGWLIYEKKKAREEIFVPFNPRFRPKDQDWIRAKLEFHSQGEHAVTGAIIEIYGQELPASADLARVVADYNLVEHHSERAVQEALEKRLEVPGKDLEGREDLRKLHFITIDGATARDFDDAVLVERKGAQYTLWVAIADVSHYVQEGRELDREARSRGTSVYFPERAFHMLPGALSENLCSLRPNEPRLALVAKIEMSATGQRLSTEVLEAVIESKRRATYDQIQEEWEAEQENLSWIYRPHFDLYAVLKKARSTRGSIDFEFPEAEISLEPSGEVKSIEIRPRKDAHRLIEEFMIAANEAVTDWMMTKKWPFVYRVHEEPSTPSLENFQALAATVGFPVSLERARSPKVLAEIVRKLEGHPAQTLLSMSLLRSMKQAIYSPTHGVHFGLASAGYTHFTSPIRRYPDLVVHRLLRMALRTEKAGHKLKAQVREQLEKELTEICEHCSYRERLASDAERDAIKLKQVRVMLKYVGSEFDGKVVGMVNSGLFIQISDPYVEGMLSGETMTDDYYEFHEERMVFQGRRNRKSYRIGDSIKIKVARADLERRQIDFVMVD